MAEKILMEATIGNVLEGVGAAKYELTTTTTKEKLIELSEQYENDFSNLRIMIDEDEYIIDYVFTTGSFSCPYETSDVECLCAEYTGIVSSGPILSFNRNGQGYTGKSLKFVELTDDPEPEPEPEPQPTPSENPVKIDLNEKTPLERIADKLDGEVIIHKETKEVETVLVDGVVNDLYIEDIYKMWDLTSITLDEVYSANNVYKIYINGTPYVVSQVMGNMLSEDRQDTDYGDWKTFQTSTNIKEGKAFGSLNGIMGPLNVGDKVKFTVTKEQEIEIEEKLSDIKTPLERIADALEKQVGIETEDKGYLSEQDYLERMAVAVEGGAGQGGGVTPTGEIEITENGVVDVTNYASANVNVSAELDETLLWENPNHTRAGSYASIISEEQVNSYNYLKFVCKLSIMDNPETSSLWTTLIGTDIVDFTKGDYWGIGSLTTSDSNSNNTKYTRLIYTEGTALSVASCRNASNNTLSNSNTILLKVYGVGKK